MYIKAFDGAAVIISEERDRPCSNPQGHDFNPESGAPFGHNGNCCAHCGHFVGRHEEMRDAEEAQAYAQVMLGATGPVEVRGAEWKWGPDEIRKNLWTPEREIEAARRQANWRNDVMLE